MKLLNIIGVVLVCGMGCVSSTVRADSAFLSRPDVQRYIDDQVASGKFNRPELEAVFVNVEEKPAILSIMDRPSTAKPWYKFRPIFFNERLIREGVAFWRANQATLEKAGKVYGVAPEMVVAILGIETGYGRNTGSFRLVDSLSTLGFDYPRRAEYFRNELTEFLLLSKEEGKNPLLLKGSYAGAMGWPQFMPSSYRAWAVDFDGDGKRDIWGNAADAIGSVAHYFQLHGWLHGDDVAIPVDIQPGTSVDQLLNDKFNLHYTVGQLKAMGIRPQLNVNNQVKGVLFSLETSPGVTQYWLGLNNFYVITRYNKSTLYAKVAQELSAEIKLRFMTDFSAGASAAGPAQ